MATKKPAPKEYRHVGSGREPNSLELDVLNQAEADRSYKAIGAFYGRSGQWAINICRVFGQPARGKGRHGHTSNKHAGQGQRKPT